MEKKIPILFTLCRDCTLIDKEYVGRTFSEYPDRPFYTGCPRWREVTLSTDEIICYRKEKAESYPIYTLNRAEDDLKAYNIGDDIIVISGGCSWCKSKCDGKIGRITEINGNIAKVIFLNGYACTLNLRRLKKMEHEKIQNFVDELQNQLLAARVEIDKLKMEISKKDVSLIYYKDKLESEHGEDGKDRYG